MSRRGAGRGAAGLVAQAETATEAWRAVASGLVSRPADVDHSHFYQLAAELDATLIAVSDVCRLLATAVLDYGDTPGIYDDSRGSWGSAGSDPVDPQTRLEHAHLAVDDASAALATAERFVSEFWSAIGHIGVDEPATGGDDQ